MNEQNVLAFFDEHLRSFVPPGGFDVHAHLYRAEDGVASLPQHLEDPSGTVGWQSYRRALREWMGESCPSAGLFFAFPKPSLDRNAANEFVAGETDANPPSRALLLVAPDDDPAEVEAAIKSKGYAGFKVYHVYAPRDRTFDAAPGEFLPDFVWRIAHERRLVIMLHLVRRRALADPVNGQYVRRQCERYPGARLILAHAARGFCAAHTVEGIASLRGIDNVWFDTSAVCESDALSAVLREFGPRRLLFGTDFPVSELTGRCVSIGDGFVWLDEKNVDWNGSEFAQPIRVGLESLLALRNACRSHHLTDGDVEQIFDRNARELLGSPPGCLPGEAASNSTPGCLPGEAASNRNDSNRRHSAQAVYDRAKQLIPGGTQLLSKRPEMYAPDCWPAYYSEARGCEVIDTDGRRYCDMTTSGIGSCLLGYADPDVVAAVTRRVQLGSMATLNSAEEVELAELLIALHPWADQVRYARTGGESLAVAVRIARAATGADRVAFCGYHGWSDWYLAANLREAPAETEQGTADHDPLRGHLLPGLEPAGVPSGLAGTALPFAYNRLDQLQEIVRKHGRNLAAVVMEPMRTTEPAPGFLQGVREVCDECGAVLVFDEVSSGWRFVPGGLHLRLGVVPDVAVFAKAIGNGHPMGAIVGRRRVMQAAERSFISSTYWTEGVGPAAALATIRKIVRCDVPAHVEKIGTLFRDGVRSLGERHGVPIRVTGAPALLHIGFDHSSAAALGTLLTKRMLDRGFLTGSGFYPSYAHTARHVDAYTAAADEVFAELAAALRTGDIEQRLATPVRHSGFARLA